MDGRQKGFWLLLCFAEWSGTELLTFQRNLLPPQGERERDTDMGEGAP
jgi:hypothetical protein